MKETKNRRKTLGKMKVKDEVKITLWLLLISAALLVGFSLWGNLIDPLSKGLTGAVVGTQDEVNTTNNSSLWENITLLPENNQTPLNESNNGSNVDDTNNNSDTSNSSDLNNTSNESTTSNESNDSIGSTTSTTTIGGTGLGVLDESSSGGIGVAGGGIGISEDANSTACGYVNDDVTLTSNINTSVSCFVVNASNIIIDGAGFMVNGTLSSSAHGVNVTGFNNITIKNLNIQQFSISYFIARSQNSTIFNSSGINASDDNVQLLNVYGLNFTNNTINNATNQLIQLTSVNQSMFQNNRLVITDDIAMSFITSVSQNNNITGNNISFIGASAVTSAIQMGTTSTSNNIDVYNNTFHITRATAGIRGGYNGEVTNNTFYLGLKGDIQGNAYGIDPESNRDMLYLGNTILGFAERSNGIGSGAAGSNNTFRENFLNLSGALSQGMSFSTNCGSGNIYIQNYVKVNNTGGGTGRAFQYNCPSNTGSAILINNTFVNPLLAFQVALAATRGSSIVMLNNTYNQSNISFSGNLLPIDIQWWVVVNVTASNGTPLANANVTGFNLTRNKEQSLVTDASGLVKLNLTEKKQNQSFQSFLDTPHDINITLDGYLPNSTTVNLSATQSTQIDLVLAANDTTNPSVAINSPNSNQYYNANFIVNATVTDDGTLSTVQYRYENSTTNGSYAAMSQSGSYWNATFDLTSVSNGNYTFRINATDTSNNQNTTVTVIDVAIDTLNPQLSITLPVNNSNHSSSKMSIEGTASDTNPDRIVVNDTAFGSNLGSYTSWNFTNTTMVEGTFTVLVTANDSAGNANSTAITFTVDTTAPNVQGFNTPVSRQNFTTGDTVVFNASISNGSGTAIHVVQFQLENGTNGLVNVTASTTNGTLYNFSITIGSGSGIAEGNRTVTIFANDTAGNMNNSVSTTFVVDRTAPNTIQLYNLTERSNISKNVPTFSFQVNDSLSPTMSCELIIDAVVNVTAISAANGTTINQAASRSLVDGNHNWSMNCNDTVRLSNISITNNFTIDTTPPYNITLNEPSEASTQTSSSVQFNWTAIDALFTTMSCNLTINGAVNQTNIATVNDTQTNVTVSTLSDGSYSWNVTCADGVLLTNSSATRTFTVDTSTPSAPTGGGSGGGGGGGSSSSGGTAAAAPSAPSSETATPTRSPERSTQTFATPTEVQQLLREQRFSISVVPTAVAEVAREERPTALQTALTGRAIGPPPERQVERRSLVNIRRVSVTFVNEGEKAIRIAPAVKDRSPIKLVDERRAEELVEERIRAALPTTFVPSPEEIRREVENSIETLKKVEEERVQFISTTKALAPQKGLFFLPNVDGSVSYSGGHTTGKLLKTEIINPEETTVEPKQTVTKEFDVRLPISLTPKPVTLSFTTQGEEILTKEVDVTEKVRVGTALSIDIAQSIIDAYILIPKYDKNSAKSEKKYLLEFNINERQSFFFPSSRYSEIFGPYELGQDTIFAQELSYDPEAYKGILPVSLKIYEEGELIAENDYTVNFGSGDVKEGFDLSLLTGFAVAGRAVFAGLNQNTQRYSTYLIDGFLLILLTFFLIVGTAYLHRMVVGVIPHKPITGAVPRQKVTMMPKTIRSIFFEKELSHLNQRLSSLEGEEISALLWQDGQRMKQALERKEKVFPKVFPTILKQSERYQKLDKELLKVQNAIENVEKTEVRKTKVRTLLSPYRPTTAYPSERKTAIDKELEKITTTLGRAERKPNSLLEKMFPIIHKKDVKENQKAMREVLRISRKVEGKNPRPSNELLEIEQRLRELDRITEQKVKLRKDIPTRSEMGKVIIKEMIQLQNEKAIIEKRLSGVGERNDFNRINILKTGIKPTKELSDIERRLANVDTESEKVKGRVLITVPSVNVYEREKGVTEALREQRPRQKRELKRSPELEEIEKAILNVEKPFPLKTNVRTIIPDRRAKHVAAIEELKRLSEEYRDVDSVLKNDGEGTLRKRRIAMPTPSPELLNVEKKIAEVEVMVPRKMKIKRELSGILVEKEMGGERKSTIDKELEEITRTLEQGERRPASLLERLFPKGKSASEKKKEREAVREVARISRKVEGKNRQPVNELIDVEKKLEKLKKELREK